MLYSVPNGSVLVIVASRCTLCVVASRWYIGSIHKWVEMASNRIGSKDGFRQKGWRWIQTEWGYRWI